MRPPQTRYVTVGNSEVAYQVLGDGPTTLVYHHGFCHLDLKWDVPPEAAFTERLASFSRLILFDRRGIGASERGSRGPTWEDWSEDLRAVLDAAGVESTAIFVEAEAGATAILFAATYPDRVTSLILGNTTARYVYAPDYPIGAAPEVIDAWMTAIRESWGTADMIRAVLPGLAHDEAAIEALAKLSRASANPGYALALYSHIFKDLDVRHVLHLIRAPTLVLHNESPDRAAHARYLADHIPGARIVEVSGDNYLFFGGDFAPVIREVAEFLTGERLPVETDRILTTVLFTDIVGSTERASEMGDRAWRGLLDTHHGIARRELERHRGRLIDFVGDGLLATFDGPARAVRCAFAIIAAVRAAGLEVRAGLHTGEVEIAGADVSGITVHIGARVVGVAGAGEVLVSSTVKDLVAGAGLRFVDRGSHVLKGVPGEWQLFAASL